jgi:hypothetical protein
MVVRVAFRPAGSPMPVAGHFVPGNSLLVAAR